MHYNRASEGLQPSMNVVSFPSISNVVVSSHETIKSLKWINKDAQVPATHVQSVWQELDHRIDICRVTKSGHIEHLQGSTETWSVSLSVDMLPFGVTIPPTVPQRSEIPEGLTNYPVVLFPVTAWKRNTRYLKISSILERAALAAFGKASSNLAVV